MRRPGLTMIDGVEREDVCMGITVLIQPHIRLTIFIELCNASGTYLITHIGALLNQLSISTF